jgi:hypothetical protein
LTYFARRREQPRRIDMNYHLEQPVDTDIFFSSSHFKTLA